MLRSSAEGDQGFELVGGGLTVVKVIEECQLLRLLAPVNNSNVDRHNAKEMLKRQRALQKAAKKAATGEKKGTTMPLTMAVVEFGSLEESLGNRLWRLMDCFKETLRVSEKDCDALRAAGLTPALEGKLLVCIDKAAKTVSGWSSMRNA